MCWPEVGRLQILGVGILVVGSWTSVSGQEKAERIAFSPPDQFLVDKETDFVAIVEVKRTESRWVIISHGDHLPLGVAECEMKEVLAGSKAWAVGARGSVVQYEYSEMLSERIAPPVIEGRRYVLWALATPKDGEVPPLAPWTAHPQGFLQVRGTGGGEFVHWNGRSYSVTALRDALRTGRRLPLDQIVDAARRLRVARQRMQQVDLVLTPPPGKTSL
jgi:hypothetical protein